MLLIANITGKIKSVSICFLLLTGSRPALTFSFWHPVSTTSHLHSASGGSATRHPPPRWTGFALWGGAAWAAATLAGGRGRFAVGFSARMVRPRAQICKSRVLRLRFCCPKSPGVLLCHDIWKPLRSRYLLPLQRPDCPKRAASQGSASRPGQRAGEGARRATLRAGSLCTPGVLPCPGTHPPWDAHTCRPSLSRPPGVASHLWAFKDTGKPARKCSGQNVCCGFLCAHTGLQENQNSQAHGTMWSLEDHCRFVVSLLMRWAFQSAPSVASVCSITPSLQV